MQFSRLRCQMKSVSGRISAQVTLKCLDFFPKALPLRDGVTAVPWVFFVVEEGLEVIGNVVERVQLACKAAVEDADEAAGFEECGQIGQIAYSYWAKESICKKQCYAKLICLSKQA